MVQKPNLAAIGMVCLLLLGLTLNAQNPEVNQVSLKIEPIGSDGTFNPAADPGGAHDFSQDSIKISLICVLNQSTGISKVHVKLGTSLGASDLVNRTFIFDQTSGLPPGFKYERKGNVIYLGLGEYYGLSAIYSDVDVEEIGGNHSPKKSAHF